MTRHVEAMTEEQILQLIRAGGRAREKGFEGLYWTMGTALLRFFERNGLTRDEAEDVVQDTIVKIMEGATSQRGAGKARSWLWTVARNCLTDHLRKRGVVGRFETVFDDDAWDRLQQMVAAPHEEPVDEAMQECVRSGVAKFRAQEPERTRALMLQAEGAHIKEIARCIQRSVAATKEYLSQCRKKLLPFLVHCRELLPE